MADRVLWSSTPASDKGIADLDLSTTESYMTDATFHSLIANGTISTSVNAAAVLDAAVRKAHPEPLGSEHFLWALFNTVDGYPRVLKWMATMCDSAVDGDLIRIPVHGLAKVEQRWTRGGEGLSQGRMILM